MIIDQTAGPACIRASFMENFLIPNGGFVQERCDEWRNGVVI